MITQELFAQELKNMYAFLKQTNDYFNGSDIYFLDEKHQLLLASYLKLNCENENHIVKAVQTLDVNPGNTTDSVVEEILQNLRDIAGQDIEDKVKAKGYLLSLNRLFHYQKANVQNISSFIPKDEDLQSVVASTDRLSELQQQLLPLD